MLRVLHLLSRQPDFQTRRMASAIQRGAPELSIEARTIGRGGDWRNVLFAARGLRRQGADVLHAWDAGALTAAALGSERPIVYSPEVFPTSRHAHWVKAVAAFRSVQLICATVTEWRGWVRQGVAAERCHLVRPGVDFSRIRCRRDASLREALGFAPSDFVVLAAGESTRNARHDHAVWAVSMLHIFDSSYKLLLWGPGERAASAHRLGVRLKQPDLVHMGQERLGRSLEFEELLPAADAIVIAADQPIVPLPIAISMAAGIPLVSTVTPIASELLEDRHTCLMIPAGKPRLIAQRIRELREDEQRNRSSLADRARGEAYEYFSQSDFVERCCTVYRQLTAGERVILPGEEDWEPRVTLAAGRR